MYKNFEEKHINRLEFVHDVNVFDNEIIGNKYYDNDTLISSLFISKSIKELNDKVLVILSSKSPRNITIFTVDKQLNVNLIYDDFDFKNNIETICNLDYVEIKKDGIIEIVGKDGLRCHQKNRSIVFDSRSGLIKGSGEVEKRDNNKLKGKELGLGFSRNEGVIYFYNEETKIDSESFEIFYLWKEVAPKFVKDKNNVYEVSSLYTLNDDKSIITTDVINIVEGAHLKTFEVLSCSYAKDKNNVYYYYSIRDGSKIMDGADSATFKIVDYESNHSKDKNNCYYEDKIVDMSECEKFEK